MSRDNVNIAYNPENVEKKICRDMKFVFIIQKNIIFS